MAKGVLRHNPATSCPLTPMEKFKSHAPDISHLHRSELATLLFPLKTRIKSSYASIHTLVSCPISIMSDIHEPNMTFLAPAPEDLAPFFPGYEIHGLIATGGMGAVYLALQKSLERLVAIKILPQEFTTDTAFCAGFEAEAKAMARLNHPNLIGVYDFGEINGMLFIIMEYVPGKSLYHSAHGLAIDSLEVIRLVSGICAGLAHAHSHGIIHRDIKPSNILLDQAAEPKIGDFGLAHPIGRTIEVGEGIFGTPHYTAPEVVNTPQSVDYRADIFSVGVLLHELLTGRLPADDPRPASVIIPCDPRFDAIIRRATDPMPTRRYNSAAEIANDLRSIAPSPGHRPGPATHNPGPPRAVPGRTKAKTRPKKSSSLPQILLLLLTCVIAAAAYQYFAPRPSKKAARTVTPPPVAHVTPTPTPPPAPAPEVTPAVTPAPVAEVTPSELPEATPDIMLDPDTTPAPDAAPDAAADVKPAVKQTIIAARQAILAQSAPILAKYHASIQSNFDAYQKAVLRSTANQLTDEERSQTLEHLKGNGGRVPQTLEYSFSIIPGVAAIHSQSLASQSSIDHICQQSLAKSTPAYISALQKYLDRLNTESNPYSIIAVQTEIHKAHYDKSYLPNILLNRANAAPALPAPPPN